MSDIKSTTFAQKSIALINNNKDYHIPATQEPINLQEAQVWATLSLAESLAKVENTLSRIEGILDMISAQLIKED